MSVGPHADGVSAVTVSRCVCGCGRVNLRLKDESDGVVAIASLPRDVALALCNQVLDELDALDDAARTPEAS